MCKFIVTCAAVIVSVALPHGSLAQTNTQGGRLFELCRSCHSLDPASKPTPGPNLAGLLGRKIAGDAKFDYSPVLRAAATNGDSWTRERLDRFLRDPEEMFPAMWMTGKPMPNAAERKALTDFLADPKSR